MIHLQAMDFGTMKIACVFLSALTAFVPAARSEINLSNGLVQATWQLGDHGPTAGSCATRPPARPWP